MKKKFIIVAIGILTLAVMYLGYKCFLLINYKANASEAENGFIEKLKDSGNTISIKNVDISDTEKTKEFANVVYQDILGGFSLDETETSNAGSQRYETYKLNDNYGNLTAMFKVGTSDYDYYDLLISDDILTYSVDLKNINRKKLVEKFNINNNVDFVKYVIKHYKDVVNIFSSRDEMEMNYLIKTFTNTVIPVSKIDIINGDLNGCMFIIRDKAYYEIHLLHNEEKYFFTFANGMDKEYFTLDDIKDFISKIHFK